MSDHPPPCDGCDHPADKLEEDGRGHYRCDQCHNYWKKKDGRFSNPLHFVLGSPIEGAGGYTIPRQFMESLTDPFTTYKGRWFHRWSVQISSVYEKSETAWINPPLAKFWLKRNAEKLADRLNRFIRDKAQVLAKVQEGDFAAAFPDEE